MAPYIPCVLSAVEAYQEDHSVMSWHGAPLFREHYILPVGEEIARLASNNTFVQVNVFGAPGTGKTSITEALSGLTQNYLHDSFGMIYDTRILRGTNEVLSIRDMMAAMDGNVILTVDDMSFARATANLGPYYRLNVLDTIRHAWNILPRSVMFLNCMHYHDLPSDMLRAAHMTVYTSLDDILYDELKERVSSRYWGTMSWFRAVKKSLPEKQYWTMSKGRNTLEYKWREPFDIAMIIQDGKPRFVVYPYVQYVDKP